LAGGSLSNREIFESQGHGAVFLAPPGRKRAAPGAIAGPGFAGSLFQAGTLFRRPGRRYAIMLAGNCGLLKALARHFPDLPLNSPGGAWRSIGNYKTDKFRF
jgi:hypothetical protein